MALFQYQVMTPSGSRKKGLIEAGSVEEAKQRLKEQEFMIMTLTPKSSGKSKEAFSTEELVVFTVQLSQLLNAGLPLFESLMTLEEQNREETFHRVILGLAEGIKAGSPLSTCMRRYPGSFDTLYCSMIQAGEVSGALDQILERLSIYLTKQQKMKKQLVTSMIYPAVLASFSFLLIIMLLTFVVPSIAGIFAGRELNAFTNIVLTTSDLFNAYWIPLFVVTAGVIFGTVYYLKTPQGASWWQHMSLRIPFIRTLVTQAAIGRFAQTMATLQKGGLNLVDALRLGRGVLKNEPLEELMKQAEEGVVEGRSLGGKLKKSPLIPSLVSRMVSVGEDTGDLASMWSKIAEMYEGELDKTLSRVTALAQPVILLVMGFVIGFILLAILLPLTDLSSLSGI